MEDQLLDGKIWTEQYPVTFYATLMMIMGDAASPTNGIEYILASFIVVLGVTMNATVFASIASYAAQFSAEATMHKNKMGSIRRSLQTLRLPAALENRIHSYYQYCWTRHRDFAAQNLLDDLPAVFQRRCAMHSHEARLRTVGPRGHAHAHAHAYAHADAQVRHAQPRGQAAHVWATRPCTCTCTSTSTCTCTSHM